MIYALFFCSLLSNREVYCLPSPFAPMPYATMEDCLAARDDILSRQKKPDPTTEIRCLQKETWH